MRCVYMSSNRNPPAPNLRMLVARPIGWLGLGLLMGGLKLIEYSRRISGE